MQYANVMLAAAKENPSKPKVLTYSLTQTSRIIILIICNIALSGASFTLISPTGRFAVQSPLFDILM